MISSKEIVLYVLISVFLGGVYLFRHNKWRVALLCTLALLLATAFGGFNLFGLDTSVISNYVHRLRFSTPELLLLQHIPTLAVYFLSLFLGAITCIIFTDSRTIRTFSSNSIKVCSVTISKSFAVKSRVASFNRIGFVLRN